VGNIGASRGLQIPSRRYHSPYWKPRHARGFLLLIGGVIPGEHIGVSDEMGEVVEELWPKLAHKLPPKNAGILGCVFTFLSPHDAGIVAEDGFQPRVSLLAKFVAVAEKLGRFC